jgi:hypothetical protein
MKNKHLENVEIVGGAGHTVHIPLEAQFDKALIAKML